ncbi:Transposase-like protein [Theobroma cacao]|uniref:Transposase-like protein n=1 Tax=Theobroma cacao TaxID=3641 RepID=A0A061DMI3_THECC|nr:Transposase-like protein [Theobroma cacao]
MSVNRDVAAIVMGLREVPGRDNFDVLIWWKLNSHRYPTLALLARDVLAIPPSTVASESAFSTGGRVLDAYKSSLMPKMVQALICAQDWQRGPSYYLHDTENDLAELEKVDEELLKIAVDNVAAENPTQAPAIALPFVAPLLSPASFLPSEPPSVVVLGVVGTFRSTDGILTTNSDGTIFDSIRLVFIWRVITAISAKTIDALHLQG